MITSSAVVGSSATSTSGSPASAMAIRVRCSMPTGEVVRVVPQPPCGCRDAHPGHQFDGAVAALTPRQLGVRGDRLVDLRRSGGSD